jgi:hypothetical protein
MGDARGLPDRQKPLNTEVEGSAVLRVVIRRQGGDNSRIRGHKTVKQRENDFIIVLEITAVALYKSPINAVTNPNPVCSH